MIIKKSLLTFNIVNWLFFVAYVFQEELDTKGAIRIRISKKNR